MGVAQHTPGTGTSDTRCPLSTGRWMVLAASSRLTECYVYTAQTLCVHMNDTLVLFFQTYPRFCSLCSECLRLPKQEVSYGQ